MTLDFDPFGDIESRCIAEFGAMVWLRCTEFGEFEALISGAWYTCSLSDFEFGMGADGYIESLKRIRDKHMEATQ